MIIFTVGFLDFLSRLLPSSRRSQASNTAEDTASPGPSSIEIRPISQEFSLSAESTVQNDDTTIASCSSHQDEEYPADRKTSDLCYNRTLVDNMEEAGIGENQEARVHFSDVAIRTHELIVGDNPYTLYSLSLGWRYSEIPPTPVDEYDAAHHEHSEYTRAQHMTPYTLEERQLRLRHVGYTKAQLLQAERRRKIQTILEWAYRRCRNRSDVADYPCPIPQPNVFIERYIK